MNVSRSLVPAALLAALFVTPLARAADPTPIEAATIALAQATYDTPEAIVKARAQIAVLQAADPKDRKSVV